MVNDYKERKRKIYRLLFVILLISASCSNPEINNPEIPVNPGTTKYSITVLVSNPEWGSIECEVDSEYPGKLVFIKIRPTEGYRPKKSAFKVNNGSIPLKISYQGSTLTSYYFTMPNLNVTITVDFEPFPPAEILNIHFSLDREQFNIQKVNFSGNESAQITFNNLDNRSIFIAHVNTSDSEIEFNKIGNRNIGNIAGSEKSEIRLDDNFVTTRVMEFNRNPAPLPPPRSRSALPSAAPFVPHAVGDTRKFWVELYINDSIDWYEIDATVQAVSDHCNIWVANDNFDDSSTSKYDYKITRAQVETYAEKFDAVYDYITNIFGFEYGGGLPAEHHEYGGVDGDPKIQILIFNVVAAGGFFSSVDHYPQDYLDQHYSYLGPGYYKSNNAEIFYMDAPSVDYAPDYMYSAMVHEFQHMINFNQKYVKNGKNSSSWYDEMLSMLAEDIISPLIGITPNISGHPIRSEIPDFLGGYAYLGITDESYLNGAFYGKTYAFGAYLARNYGGAELIKAIANNNTVDIDSLNSALLSLNPGVTFSAVFNRYVEAFLCTDPAKGMTFNKTVTQTINGITYTLTGFNILDIKRSIVDPSLTEYSYTTSEYKGPAVFALGSVFPLDEMKGYSLIIQSLESWQGVSGNLTINIEKPLHPAVDVYVIVR
jgi:hypothetical protein